jgi:hypothetical protein
VLRPNAPDARIATSDGTIVPHILRRATAKRVRRVSSACGSRVEKLTELPDNRIQLDMVIPESSPAADTLIFTTPLQNFERQITVEGVNPDGTTEPLVTDALIYDYSRYMDMRHLSVDIPRNDFHNLRITVEAVTVTALSPHVAITRTIRDGNEVERTESTETLMRPFRIDSATLYTHQDQASNREPVTTNYSVLPFEEESKQASATTFLVAVSNTPLTALVIDTPSRNFSRRCTVEAPYRRDGRTQWRTLADTTLSRVSFRSFQQQQVAIHFPEQQHDTLRLTFHNGEAPPLTINGVSGQGPQWQAFFLAQPNVNYELLAGSETIKPPTFDTAHLEKLLARDIEPMVCTMKELVLNPDFNPDAGRSAFAWLGSRQLFIIGIIVVVAILAIGLIRASKTVLDDRNSS